MIQKEVLIKNKNGLRVGPASVFAATASKFESEITIKQDTKEVNAKSVINLLLLGIQSNTMITIKSDGNDEDEAIESLVDLVDRDFNLLNKKIDQIKKETHVKNISF